jgi:hypothetical protein
MASTANTGNEAPGNQPMDGLVVIHTTHVRFSIAQKAESNTVPIPSIMHKIMNKRGDHDNGAIFHDITDNIISTENFPVEKRHLTKLLALLSQKNATSRLSLD